MDDSINTIACFLCPILNLINFSQFSVRRLVMAANTMAEKVGEEAAKEAAKDATKEAVAAAIGVPKLLPSVGVKLHFKNSRDTRVSYRGAYFHQGQITRVPDANTPPGEESWMEAKGSFLFGSKGVISWRLSETKILTVMWRVSRFAGDNELAIAVFDIGRYNEIVGAEGTLEHLYIAMHCPAAERDPTIVSTKLGNSNQPVIWSSPEFSITGTMGNTSNTAIEVLLHSEGN